MQATTKRHRSTKIWTGTATSQVSKAHITSGLIFKMASKNRDLRCVLHPGTGGSQLLVGKHVPNPAERRVTPMLCTIALQARSQHRPITGHALRRLQQVGGTVRRSTTFSRLSHPTRYPHPPPPFLKIYYSFHSFLCFRGSSGRLPI